MVWPDALRHKVYIPYFMSIPTTVYRVNFESLNFQKYPSKYDFKKYFRKHLKFSTNIDNLKNYFQKSCK